MRGGPTSENTVGPFPAVRSIGTAWTLLVGATAAGAWRGGGDAGAKAASERGGGDIDGNGKAAGERGGGDADGKAASDWPCGSGWCCGCGRRVAVRSWLGCDELVYGE